jgi:hypothetical protein
MQDDKTPAPTRPADDATAEPETFEIFSDNEVILTWRPAPPERKAA